MNINKFLVLYFLNFFTLCDIMIMSIGKVFQEKSFKYKNINLIYNYKHKLK